MSDNSQRPVIGYENIALFQGNSDANLTGSNSGDALKFIPQVQNLSFSFSNNQVNIDGLGSKKTLINQNTLAPEIRLNISKIEDFENDLFSTLIPYGDFKDGDLNKDRNFYAIIGDTKGSDVSSKTLSGKNVISFGNCFLENVTLTQDANAMLMSNYSFVASNIQAQTFSPRVIYHNSFEQLSVADYTAYDAGGTFKAKDLEDSIGLLSVTNHGIHGAIGTGEGIVISDQDTKSRGLETVTGFRSLVIHDGAIINGIGFHNKTGDGLSLPTDEYYHSGNLSTGIFNTNSIYEVTGNFRTNNDSAYLDIFFQTGNSISYTNVGATVRKTIRPNLTTRTDAHAGTYISTPFSVTGSFNPDHYGSVKGSGAPSGCIMISSRKLSGYAGLTGIKVEPRDSTYKYVSVPGGITFENAFNEAIQNHEGRLAVIDTLEKFHKFTGTFGNDAMDESILANGWVALTDSESYGASESNAESTLALKRAKFKWSNGVENIFTDDIYWNDLEPNNSAGLEDFIHFRGTTLTPSTTEGVPETASAGPWNDLSATSITPTGFYIEQINSAVFISDLTIRKLDEFQLDAPSIDLTGPQIQNTTGYFNELNTYYKSPAKNFSKGKNTKIVIKKKNEGTIVFKDNFASGIVDNDYAVAPSGVGGFSFSRLFHNGLNSAAGDEVTTGINRANFFNQTQGNPAIQSSPPSLEIKINVGDTGFAYGNPSSVYSGAKAAAVRIGDDMHGVGRTGFKASGNYILQGEFRVSMPGGYTGAVARVDISDYESHNTPQVTPNGDLMGDGFATQSQTFVPFDMRITGFNQRDPRTSGNFKWFDLTAYSHKGGFPNAQTLNPPSPDGSTSFTNFLNSGSCAAQFRNITVREVQNFEEENFLFETDTVQNFDITLPVERKSVYQIGNKYPSKRKRLYPNNCEISLAALMSNINKENETEYERYLTVDSAKKTTTANLKSFIEENAKYEILISGVGDNDKKYSLHIDNAYLTAQDISNSMDNFSLANLSFGFDMQDFKNKNYLNNFDAARIYVDRKNERCVPNTGGLEVFDISDKPLNKPYPETSATLNFAHPEVSPGVANLSSNNVSGKVGLSEDGFVFDNLYTAGKIYSDTTIDGNKYYVSNHFSFRNNDITNFDFSNAPMLQFANESSFLDDGAAELHSALTYLLWIKPYTLPYYQSNTYKSTSASRLSTLMSQALNNESRPRFTVDSFGALGFQSWGMNGQVFTGDTFTNTNGSKIQKLDIPRIFDTGSKVATTRTQISGGSIIAKRDGVAYTDQNAGTNTNFSGTRGTNSNTFQFSSEQVVQTGVWQQVVMTLENRTGSLGIDHSDFGTTLQFYHNDTKLNTIDVLSKRTEYYGSSSNFATNGLIDLSDQATFGVNALPSSGIGVIQNLGRASEGFRIGGTFAGSEEPYDLFKGEIAVAAVYNKALTHEEVKDNYNKIRQRFDHKERSNAKSIQVRRQGTLFQPGPDNCELNGDELTEDYVTFFATESDREFMLVYLEESDYLNIEGTSFEIENVNSDVNGTYVFHGLSDSFPGNFVKVGAPAYRFFRDQKKWKFYKSGSTIEETTRVRGSKVYDANYDLGSDVVIANRASFVNNRGGGQAANFVNIIEAEPLITIDEGEAKIGKVYYEKDDDSFRFVLYDIKSNVKITINTIDAGF